MRAATVSRAAVRSFFRVSRHGMVAVALLRVFSAALHAVFSALHAVLVATTVHRRLAVFAVFVPLAAAGVLALAARHAFRRLFTLILHVLAARASILGLRLRSARLGRRRLLRR